MEKELLEMAEQWKKTALEMIQKSATGSRSEMVNQMLWRVRRCWSGNCDRARKVRRTINNPLQRFAKDKSAVTDERVGRTDLVVVCLYQVVARSRELRHSFPYWTAPTLDVQLGYTARVVGH